jgi:diacylglycerol O-acyltransferase / wax synthase
MSQRLRPRDLAFLAEESASTPLHNATVEIFEPGDSGFDYQCLVALIRDRISFVPRYRQRVQSVPGRLANPIWVDDPDFDIGFHVRRSALPRPGSMDQLRELVARIVSRPLDRHRPLWEVYFVEGLDGGRVAVLSKSHQALVDGIDTVDLGQVLLDVGSEQRMLGNDEWNPPARPSPAAVVAGAFRDSVRQPGTVLDTLRSNAGSARRVAEGAVGRAGTITDALTNRRPTRESPISGELSQQRRFVTVRTDLASYRKVRRAHDGTINDVILATITGGLRTWLMTRAESLGGLRKIKAVVPVSVIDEELEATSLGSQIAAHLVSLPVGEPSAVVRLHQVSYSFQAHKETGRAVAANRLAGIAGFAPATFHAIGSRVAADELRRGAQISITNVPGPQSSLYAAGARMLETYPVHPLTRDHAVAIGVTSYDGAVYYGITTDRYLLPDADVLGQCIIEALDELLDSASGGRPRLPRGRKK